jgi:GNAT superfamily N-acetyltransferase
MLTDTAIRPYIRTDRHACIALFESNVPAYFGAHERQDFLDCIDEEIGPYFVMQNASGELLGCGGYAMHPESPAVASLCWGMVRRDLCGQGLGVRLLEARLECIRAEGRYDTVRIETTPMSRGFFARHGFTVLREEADGFGGGYDLVEMVLDLRST